MIALILEFFTNAVLVLLPVVILVRDWKYYKRSTRLYRKITAVTLIFMALFGLLSAVFDIQDVREMDRLQEKIDDLLALNEGLSNKITEYQRALTAQEQIIKDLEKSAKVTARGITPMYYEFNGVKREVVGGTINVVADEEFTIFQQMVDLEESGNHDALVELCERQIQETPDWLTPYLYCGVAYANLGDRGKAILYLRYVIETAPEDPDYEMAERFLHQLEQDSSTP